MIQMPEQAEKNLLTIAEAAQMLTVSDETVRRMVKDGQLDAFKVRGTWRIRRESVEKIIRQ